MKRLMLFIGFFLLPFCLQAQTRDSFLDLKDVPAGLLNGAYINAADYGVSTGATAAVNTTAMQNALNAGNTRGTPVYITIPGFYSFNSALRINPRATSIVGCSGVYLDFSAATNTNCLEYRAIPRARTTAFEQKVYKNSGWKLRCNASQVGISLLDDTGLADTSCVTFESITIDGANYAVSITSNAWQITFNDYLISSSTVHVYTGNNANTNYGEQIIFNNGLHSGTNDLCFKSENYGNQTVFNSCSIDTGLIAHVDTGATAIFNDCWFESQQDLPNKISIEGTGGLGGAAVVIRGGYLNLSAGGLKTYPPVNCGVTSTPSLGGFFCEGARIDMIYPSTDRFYFVNGIGRAHFKNLRTGTYGFNNALGGIILANTLNEIHDGGFDGVDYLQDGWTSLTASTTLLNATYSTTVYSSTPGSLQSFELIPVAVDGINIGITQSLNCKPGDTIWGGFNYKTDSLTNATMSVFLSFLSAGGTLLAEEVQSYSGTTDWTWQPYDNYLKHSTAPAGTAELRVILQMSGSATATGTGYIDDLNINIIE